MYILYTHTYILIVKIDSISDIFQDANHDFSGETQNKSLVCHEFRIGSYWNLFFWGCYEDMPRGPSLQERFVAILESGTSEALSGFDSFSWVLWGSRCALTQTHTHTHHTPYIYIYTSAKTVSDNRAASQTTWVRQQEGASQTTGRRESDNRKARVRQQEGASQTTGRRESDNQVRVSQTTRNAWVRQPGRESDNQVASQTTRSRVRQPGRESDNQVESQTTRSRVRQPGRESDNQVESQTTRSRVRQPGRESDNQVARQTTRSRVRQPGRESDNQKSRFSSKRVVPCGLLVWAGAWSCCHFAACLTTRARPAETNKIEPNHHMMVPQKQHIHPLEFHAAQALHATVRHFQSRHAAILYYIYITHTRHAVLDICRAANSMQHRCWSGDLVWNTDWIESLFGSFLLSATNVTAASPNDIG